MPYRIPGPVPTHEKYMNRFSASRRNIIVPAGFKVERTIQEVVSSLSQVANWFDFLFLMRIAVSIINCIHLPVRR